MKLKRPIMITLLIICAVIAVCAANTPKNRTLRYFNHHRAALEEDILNGKANGRAVSGLDITFNDWNGEHPIIEYIVVNRGIVSSSRYYGFFYSFDDMPVSFQNAGDPLTPVSEREWEWAGAGDNHGIVRRLDANWFYFEAYL